MNMEFLTVMLCVCMILLAANLITLSRIVDHYTKSVDDSGACFSEILNHLEDVKTNMIEVRNGMTVIKQNIINLNSKTRETDKKIERIKWGVDDPDK